MNHALKGTMKHTMKNQRVKAVVNIYTEMTQNKSKYTRQDTRHFNRQRWLLYHMGLYYFQLGSSAHLIQGVPLGVR